MITVREAEPADAPDSAAVHVSAWQAAYAHVFPPAYLSSLDHEAWTRRHHWMIDNNERVALVAVDGEQVVGFAHAGPARPVDTTPPGIGEVYAIYVDPGHWGSGAGKALMRATVDRLAAAGQTEIRVWVLDDNPRARQFYERFGFMLDGAKDTYVADEGGPHETTAEEVRYTLTVR